MNSTFSVFIIGCLYFPAPGLLLGLWPCLLPPTSAPGLGRKFVLTGPWPQFVFTRPVSQFVFIGPGLQLYCQSGDWVCIYQPCLLNLHLYLRSWPTICITGPGPEFAFILLLVVVAVVVVIAVVVISLE